jgi:hypothetical protein
MTRAQSCCCPRRCASRAACDPRRSPAAARGSVAGLGSQTPASPRGLSRGRTRRRGDRGLGVQMLPSLALAHPRPRRAPAFGERGFQEPRRRLPALRLAGTVRGHPAGRRAEPPVGSGRAENALASFAAAFERDRHGSRLARCALPQASRLRYLFTLNAWQCKATTDSIFRASTSWKRGSNAAPCESARAPSFQQTPSTSLGPRQRS